MGARLRHPVMRLGAQLALLAITLRILLPAGWMPGLDGTGSLLVFCTGQGTELRFAGVDWQPKDGPHQPAKDSGHTPCVFAAAHASAAPGAAIVPSAEPSSAPIDWDARADVRHVQSQLRLAMARAPPASV